MTKIKSFKTYDASVSQDTLQKWKDIVSVWSKPKGPREGGTVIDEIKEPMNVTVLDEQSVVWGSEKRLSKIKYGDGHEGWVLSEALTIP